MKIDITIEQELIGFDDKDLDKAIKKAVTKLGTWFNKEAMKRAKVNMRLLSPKRLAKRILKFKKSKGVAIKAWFGSSPIGVDSFGDVRQTDSGVYAGGEFYKGAFVNHMDSDEPMVWRRKTSDPQSGIERVTKPIDEQLESVMNDLSLEVNDKFAQLLEVELNAIL